MKKYDRTVVQQDFSAIQLESVLEPFSQDPSKMASVLQELFDAVSAYMLQFQNEKGKAIMLHGSMHA